MLKFEACFGRLSTAKFEEIPDAVLFVDRDRYRPRDRTGPPPGGTAEETGGVIGSIQEVLRSIERARIRSADPTCRGKSLRPIRPWDAAEPQAQKSMFREGIRTLNPDKQMGEASPWTLSGGEAG